MRRFCFESAQQKYNADYIALAHHQDDQIETFFIRLIRGATLKGLGGMQEQDGLYIRPLLNISKKTILNFLTEKNITFVEDSSNLSDEYLRNRIRNKALPVLQACDNRLNMKCIQAINHLQETEHFLTTLTETHYNQIITKKTDTDYNILNIKQLMDLDLYLQKRIVQMFIIKHKVPFNLSNNFLEEILKFIHSNKGGSHCVGPSWKLIKKQSNLWIELL